MNYLASSKYIKHEEKKYGKKIISYYLEKLSWLSARLANEEKSPNMVEDKNEVGAPHNNIWLRNTCRLFLSLLAGPSLGPSESVRMWLSTKSGLVFKIID